MESATDSIVRCTSGRRHSVMAIHPFGNSRRRQVRRMPVSGANRIDCKPANLNLAASLARRQSVRCVPHRVLRGLRRRQKLAAHRSRADGARSPRLRSGVDHYVRRQHAGRLPGVGRWGGDGVSKRVRAFGGYCTAWRLLLDLAAIARCNLRRLLARVTLPRYCPLGQTARPS